MDGPDPSFPSVDDLVAANARYAVGFSGGDLPVTPRRRLAVVACMDSRLDIFALLGLANGEAHVIRNAGGIVTDDVVRSLCLSQRLLGTREIILVHHTDCGLLDLDEDAFLEDLEAETAARPSWRTGSFADAHDDVARSIERLRADPFLVETGLVRGFVYDIATGLLDEVEPRR